jgi:hypothetical protein
LYIVKNHKACVRLETKVTQQMHRVLLFVNKPEMDVRIHMAINYCVMFLFDYRCWHFIVVSPVQIFILSSHWKI